MKISPLLTNIKKILCAVLGATGVAAAQSTVQLAPAYVHVDKARQLVLVNAPLQQLATPDSLRGIKVGSTTYVLLRPVARVSCTRAYPAVAGSQKVELHFTQIPVLELSTRHQIADTPSVYAELQLADSTGVLAKTATGIEIRGGYSQNYPKKSYELSLWADTVGAVSRDLSLLGMRTDNKWNLQAQYNDQLRLRLKVANELWQQIHQPYYQAQEPAARSGISMAYTEVFLNGSYQGIYALTERIDRKQLKLKKYAGGIKGELYKGAGWDAAVVFSGAPAYDNTSLTWSGFEYKEPTEEINWTSLHDFVSFVVNSPDATFYSQYQKQLHQANAIDYYLFINLLRAYDNTGKNAYLARYKQGEPYFYVPWDLDGVLGNDWAGHNDNVVTGLPTNGLFDRLMRETTSAGFRTLLGTRWNALRSSVITPANINRKLLAANAYLQANNAYAREHLAWPDFTYDPAQLTYPMTWLTGRLAYLDDAFRPVATALAANPAAAPARLQLYPNPAQGFVEVEAPAGPLLVQDLSGRTVLQATLTGPRARLSLAHLLTGLYLVRLGSTVQKLQVQ